jgi:hypothetical protein
VGPKQHPNNKKKKHGTEVEQQSSGGRANCLSPYDEKMSNVLVEY